MKTTTTDEENNVGTDEQFQRNCPMSMAYDYKKYFKCQTYRK